MDREVELCEHGGGAGLPRSELGGFLLQLFSTAASVDIVYIICFAQAGFLSPRYLLFWWRGSCLLSAGWSAWDEHYTGI